MNENKLDYISILASGTCKGNCPFCVGRNSRDHSEPHFTSIGNIIDFLKDGKERTNELSISGSSTDPLYTTTDLVAISCYARYLGYKVSLHTHVFDERTVKLNKFVDELCVSINNKKDMNDFIALNITLDKVRVSTVVTSDSLEWLDSGELVKKIPASEFTFRKNIFEPTIRFPRIEGKKIGELFGNDLIDCDGSSLAFWDYKNTNVIAKAEYLWSDGSIHDQEYWESTYFKK